MRSGSKKDEKAVAKTPAVIVWWRVAIGIVCTFIAVGAAVMYAANIRNMLAGFVLVVALSAAGAFFYWSWNREVSGYLVKGGKRHTGRENAIIIYASSNGNGKEVPVKIKFVKLSKPPRNARLHLLRNLNKHFYVLQNKQGVKGLVPVVMPDKKSFPPSKFRIPATMQAFKEACEYQLPTTMQKVGPVAIVVAMAVVGILIVVTTGGSPTPQ